MKDMIRGSKIRGVYALLFLLLAGRTFLPAQTGETVKEESAGASSSTFPLWAKDLRRAEIVALGSLPFTLFFTAIGVDTYRYYQHGKDMNYAPWPLKPAGAAERTTAEQVRLVSLALGTSMSIALVDFVINQVKRYRQNRAARELPQGTPIIIRKPLAEEEAAGEAGAGEGAEGAGASP